MRTNVRFLARLSEVEDAIAHGAFLRVLEFSPNSAVAFTSGVFIKRSFRLPWESVGRIVEQSGV